MSYKNGYKPSLFETEDGRCYICKYNEEDPPIDTARHEVFRGPNRELSKHYGLWICVCPRHHDDIHDNPKKYLWLREAGQALFENVHPDKDFLTIFGRNYL